MINSFPPLDDKILALCLHGRNRGVASDIADEFAGPRRRRRPIGLETGPAAHQTMLAITARPWVTPTPADNAWQMYRLICQYCPTFVPGRGVPVRACMHREPIDPNFCVRTTMGRPCTLHRAEKEAWIWIRADIFSFFPRVLGDEEREGKVKDLEPRSSLVFQRERGWVWKKIFFFLFLEWNWKLNFELGDVYDTF